MQRAAQTYSAVVKQTVNPRELEADLLLDAVRSTGICDHAVGDLAPGH